MFEPPDTIEELASAIDRRFFARVLTPSFIDTMFTDVNPYLAN